MKNNQKEKLTSNKYIQQFLDNESKVSLKNNHKFAEFASSLSSKRKKSELSNSNNGGFTSKNPLISINLINVELTLFSLVASSGRLSRNPSGKS